MKMAAPPSPPSQTARRGGQPRSPGTRQVAGREEQGGGERGSWRGVAEKGLARDLGSHAVGRVPTPCVVDRWGGQQPPLWATIPAGGAPAVTLRRRPSPGPRGCCLFERRAGTSTSLRRSTARRPPPPPPPPLAWSAARRLPAADARRRGPRGDGGEGGAEDTRGGRQRCMVGSPAAHPSHWASLSFFWPPPPLCCAPVYSAVQSVPVREGGDRGRRGRHGQCPVDVAGAGRRATRGAVARLVAAVTACAAATRGGSQGSAPPRAVSGDWRGCGDGRARGRGGVERGWRRPLPPPRGGRLEM